MTHDMAVIQCREPRSPKVFLVPARRAVFGAEGAIATARWGDQRSTDVRPGGRRPGSLPPLPVGTGYRNLTTWSNRADRPGGAVSIVPSTGQANVTNRGRVMPNSGTSTPTDMCSLPD